MSLIAVVTWEAVCSWPRGCDEMVAVSRGDPKRGGGVVRTKAEAMAEMRRLGWVLWIRFDPASASYSEVVRCPRHRRGRHKK